MNPSNPNNGNAPIVQVVANDDVARQVVPQNHTHSISEITGLSDSLTGKADKVGAGQPTGAIVIANTAGELSRSNKTITDITNAIDGKQNQLIFDSTPTIGSSNPVTSDGIKRALDEKASSIHVHSPLDITGIVPTFMMYDGSVIDLDNLVSEDQGLCRLCIINEAGEVQFGDMFYSGSGIPLHTNINGDTIIEPSNYVIVTIYKIDKNLQLGEHEHDLCYFIEYNGIYNNVI